MNKEIVEDKEIKRYQLLFKDEKRKKRREPVVFEKGRYVIGRVSNCDFQIKSKKVSAIHAVIEVSNDKVSIFDMNSTNGLSVNNHKVVAADLKVGDIISFAGFEFVLSLKEKELTKDDLATGVPLFIEKSESGHPLSSLKNAEFSEYIFEDEGEIFPIIEENVLQTSVEVVVLHEDNIVSIDYVLPQNGKIFLRGKDNNDPYHDIFFPYLQKREKVLLIKEDDEQYSVNTLDGFYLEKLFKTGIERIQDKETSLETDDIIRLKRDNLEIFIRKSKEPPTILPAPIFRRDAFFHKYVIPTLLIVLLPLIVISFFNLDIEKDETEKIERIATILHQKKMLGDQIAKTPKNVKGSVSLDEKNKEENKKGETGQGKEIKLSEEKPKVELPKKVETKVKEKIVEKVINKTNTSNSKPKKKVTRNSNRRGKIQAIPNLDFTSSLNELMVSQAQLKNTDNNDAGETGVSGSDLSLDEGSTSQNQKINIGGNSSLTEGLGDRVAQDIGADGLSDKKGYFIVGVPENAVVHGSVNGGDIEKKLREHLSQLRFCVEKQLRPGQAKSDRVIFKFIIGASGYASKVYPKTRVYGRAEQECMANVIKGIAFDRPRGGGSADVEIPINFNVN